MIPGHKIGPGRLIAVVGPSGSGKDSIMRAAGETLAGNGEVVFPRRFITREADIHEDHTPISRAAFREAEAAGAFAFAWQAHGLSYGIPNEIDQMVGDGRIVVLNVSRAIVSLLRERYANLTIAVVSVDAQYLAQRLSDRNRETPEEIALRIARIRREKPTGRDVVEIDNNGPLQDAVQRFLSATALGKTPTMMDSNTRSI